MDYGRSTAHFSTVEIIAVNYQIPHAKHQAPRHSRAENPKPKLRFQLLHLQHTTGASIKT
jgi:hypothetical protein